MKNKKTASEKAKQTATIENSNERRLTKRTHIHLDIHWQSNAARINSGTIGDISRSGCFILSPLAVTPSGTIIVEIPLLDNTPVRLQGKIISVVPEIGFAVQFMLRDEDKAAIEDLALSYDL